MENLASKTKEELETIRDIGPILAGNIANYFADVDNQALIDKLKELGLNMNYLGEEQKENNLITNKRFVITGTISFMGRDEIEGIIESYGGHPSSSVSSKTDVVIVGDKPGSKADKARNLGIEIWDEEKLYSILKDLGELNE